MNEKDKNSCLSETQQLWKDIMMVKSGVLYIKGKPGTCKTAMVEKMALKMNYQYFDIRLTQIDESEVGAMPSIFKEEGYFKHLRPHWAILANQQPSVVVFEELNKANKFVRDAALQILCERRIGYDFKFNDNVLMVATGNIGEEDGTDVDEFDNALKTRLITYKHEMLFDEWYDDYAKNNVIPLITSFLRAYPAEFYRFGKEDCDTFANPRTWTNLSLFLESKFGKSPKLREVLLVLNKIGVGYIGQSITKFLRYCEEMDTVNINDILNRYDQIEVEIENFSRAKISELLVNLREIKAEKLSKVQVQNLTKFFKLVPDDEKIPYLKHAVGKYLTGKKEIDSKLLIYEFLRTYEDVVRKIKDLNEDKIEKKGKGHE